jgi:type IV secretory pathway VirB10-like protein
MNQQHINAQDEFQPDAEEVFFDEETVQRIPAVMPLDETPTRTSARFRQFRVPMRKEDKSFNPAFLIMALVAVTALGVIAGTLVYRTSTEKSANNAALETDEPVTRTIPAQYQFVVDKPESGQAKDNLPKDNLNSPPSTQLKKDSRDKQEESSAPDTETEQKTAQNDNEKVVEETEAPSEDEDEPPPPLPSQRKENKKQDKAKQKNDNAKPETQPKNEEPPSDEGNESSESSEN